MTPEKQEEKPVVSSSAKQIKDLKKRLADAEAKIEAITFNEAHNNVRREALQGIAVTRPQGAAQPTMAEMIEGRKKAKRTNKTQEEDQLYKEYTDPVTRLPPLDVRGTRERCQVLW